MLRRQNNGRSNADGDLKKLTMHHFVSHLSCSSICGFCAFNVFRRCGGHACFFAYPCSASFKLSAPAARREGSKTF